MNRVIVYLGVFMVAVIFLLAMACFFTDKLDHVVTGNNKYYLGALFLIYGFWRAARIKKQLQSLKQEQNHE